MIDHMGVQVADVEASLAFYLRAFTPIGIREAVRFPAGESFVVGGPVPSARYGIWPSLQPPATGAAPFPAARYGPGSVPGRPLRDLACLQPPARDPARARDYLTCSRC
jgi:catechol 2,3-dioxygenase-like lactoylglutathione lyase family enzyme